MPELCRFNDIRILIYHNDHSPAHFHVIHSAGAARVGIESLALLQGDLSGRARKRVMEWARQHQSELRLAWQYAQDGQPPGKIAPP